MLLAVALGLGHAPSAAAREWISNDALVDRIRHLIDRREYAAVLDTVPPLVERAEASGDSLRLGRLICARGQAELGTGRHNASLRSLARAQGLAEANADTLTLLTSLGIRALALNGQGRFAEAMEVSARQGRLAKAAGTAVGEAFAHAGQGFANLSLMRYAEAAWHYSRAERLFAEHGRPDWQLTALNGLGRAQHNLGQVDLAREAWLRVCEVARAVEDRANESAALTNLGVLEFTEFGSLERAARYFESAYRVRSKENENFVNFEVVTNLVYARSALGDWQSAVDLLEEARETARANGAMAAYYSATVRLGSVFTLQGRSHRARRLYRSLLADPNAVAVHTQASLGLAEELARADSAQVAMDIIQRRIAQTRLEERVTGDLLLSMRSWLWLLLDEPRRALEAANEALALDIVPDEEATLLTHRSRALAALGRLEESWGALADGFDAMEEARASAETLDWREVQGSNRLHAFVDASAELVRARRKVDPAAPCEDVFERLQSAKARTVLERLSSPVRASSRTVAPVSMARLRRSLPFSHVAVDLYWGTRHAMAVVIERDRTVAHVAADVGSLWDDLSLFGDVAGDRSVDWDSIRAVGTRLREKLFGSAFTRLDAATRIVFSPHERFAGFPLGLLPDATGEPLVVRRDVARLPSLALLAQPIDDPLAPSSRILALAGPPNDLAGAEAEIARLRRRYRDVSVVRGFDGLTDSLRTASILHVAVHASVDEERLWRSGFRLAHPQPEPDAPTHLYASDILETELGCELAVLAGCKTGLGRTVGSSGVAGLSSAFLVAGATAVVATLWDIDDGATHDLVGRLYDELASGRSVGEALHAAQMAIRARRRTSHPYYWAGFLVVGNPDLVVRPRVAAAGLPSTWWWILGLAGILVVGEQIRRRM